MTELWLVHKCDHGESELHCDADWEDHVHIAEFYCVNPCKGGSVEVLDPERVLVFSWWSGAKEFQVIDVLDALGGSDE